MTKKKEGKKRFQQIVTKFNVTIRSIGNMRATAVLHAAFYSLAMLMVLCTTTWFAPLSLCHAATAADEGEMPASIYDVIETDNKGQPLDFEQYKGKILFIINVASRCPYAKDHYSLFRRLFKYRSRGFEMILVPSNQFMQEPKDDKDIAIYAKKQLFSGVILTKGDVNGKTARPLFRYLKQASGKKLIEWNFDGAFLVTSTGEVSSTTKDTVEEEVRELLGIAHNEL